MKKLWSAICSDKFVKFTPAVEDSSLLSGRLCNNKQGWCLMPRENINHLLEDVKSWQKDDRKPYTVFQFFVPPQGMEELVQAAYHGNIGNSNNGFEIRILEYFEIHPKNNN